MDLREDEAAIVAFFSLVLLDEYCMVEDILRSSDLEAVISDLAAASMVMAEEVLPAVLVLCLHRWRLKCLILRILRYDHNYRKVGIFKNRYFYFCD